MLKTACLVAALALACLLVRAARVGIAGDYIDPVGRVAATDEARYADGAIRMAHGDGPAIDEPPLLYWLAGAIARIAGVSRLALRGPVALFCGLALALAFLWAAELNGPPAGVCAALLLAGDHLWHVLGSMCMADGLVAALVVGALYALFWDPTLKSAGAFWGFAGATAAAILTKGLAGAMPLAILAVYAPAARRNWRPAAGRAVLAGALALALAAPWFVYRWLAHGKWFLAERAAGIPGYGAGENPVLFYLARMALRDPILIAVSFAALPALAEALRRREPAATLLAAWLAVGALAALVWQDRNVAYLLPMIPAMAILAASFGPFAKDQATRPGLVLAIGALVVKALMPSAPWGISFGG
ncbi:MAG: glycosyltransferase family 39 protein [Bryobacteraceae bacterium]